MTCSPSVLASYWQARLAQQIAVNVELQAACEAALSLMENWGTGQLAKLQPGKQLRAALAKARAE